MEVLIDWNHSACKPAHPYDSGAFGLDWNQFKMKLDMNKECMKNPTLSN